MDTAICQTCGQPNPLDAEFCSNRSCGAFLGWSRRAATGSTAPPPPPLLPQQPPPAPPTAQIPVATAAARARVPMPGAPTQRILARLESDSTRAEPGGRGDLNLLVRNAGTVVEQFVIEVNGVPKSWVTVDPPHVNLDVDTEQRCQITIRPPRAATTTAGRMALAITITSTVDHAVIAAVNATLDVGGFTELNSTLAPFESESKKSGEHQLIVSNEGNVNTHVTFSGTDPGDKLRIGFDPISADLIPAQQAYVRVLAAPRRRTWFANPKRHQFSVTVTPPTGAATQHNASMNQLARFPHWVPKAVAALLAVLLAVGIPLLIRQLNKADANAPVAVPHVTGLSFDQAVVQLQNLGLLADKATEAVSQGERDKVFAQDPAEGVKVKKKTVVKLTMSAGPGRSAIADVQAFSSDDAQKTLEALGLKVTISAQKVQNRDIAAGLVVRTNPPAGTQVDVGTSVEMVLSDGPPPKPLPLLDGEYTDVSKQLIAAGFPVKSPAKNMTTKDATQMGKVAACALVDSGRTCAASEKEGTTLQLSVFVLGDQVAVPKEVLTKSVADATALLTAQQFRVDTTIITEPSATAAIGTVIKTSPAVGATTNKGSVIQLTVSGGPPVAVPNLTGLTIRAAGDKLASVGLKTFPGNCKDTDNLTSQSPAAGVNVSKGDTISLGCSRCSLTFCVDIKNLTLSQSFQTFNTR